MTKNSCNLNDINKSLFLGLHTRGQWPKNNTLLNAYITILFVSFGAKSMAYEQKFVDNIIRNPNSPQENKLFFPNL
jgi:hypothetical protein